MGVALHAGARHHSANVRVCEKAKLVKKFFAGANGQV